MWIGRGEVEKWSEIAPVSNRFFFSLLFFISESSEPAASAETKRRQGDQWSWRGLRGDVGEEWGRRGGGRPSSSPSTLIAESNSIAITPNQTLTIYSLTLTITIALALALTRVVVPSP